MALFVLTELAFYVEHRCSHRVALLWASHSVHHSTDQMVTSAAFRLAWTPLLSGVFLFYLPVVWIGFDPVWVFGMASASLTFQFFVHTELVPQDRIAGVGDQYAVGTSGASCQQPRVYRQKFRRRADDMGPPVRNLSGGAEQTSRSAMGWCMRDRRRPTRS